jgi:hypothetical protein
MARRNMPYGGKAVPMEPGERTSDVRVESRAPAVGGAFPHAPWSVLVARLWMKRIDATQKEREAAAGTSAAIVTRWEMGYRADMDPELVDVAALRRLVFRGRVFEVTGGTVIGAREGVELETIARSGS